MKLLWQEAFVDFAIFHTVAKISGVIISIAGMIIVWVNHRQPQMFNDEITICHCAMKVSCLVCYTVILKLHIIDRPRYLEICSYYATNQPQLNLKNFLLYHTYVISATFVCMDMCFQYFMHA